MSGRWWILIGWLLCLALPAGATTEEPVKVLRAYGPGGPHHVLQECAELFQKKHGIVVTVIKASPKELAQKVAEDGDLYFGGAEYMLHDFARKHPDVLDLQSAENLYARRIGIVVRKGNPLNIQGFECLQRDGIDLLAVHLENMTHFLAPPADRMSNIRHLAYTGQDGVEAWLETPELDAWVTYKSWHVRLEEEADFIEIPESRTLRFTPVALTHRTPHREAARQFIAFLKSREVRQIFVEHGWE